MANIIPLKENPHTMKANANFIKDSCIVVVFLKIQLAIKKDSSIIRILTILN